MAVQLPVPKTSYSELDISLAGRVYIFVYRFNTRFKKYEDDLGTWVIDILSSDREYLLKGLAVVGQGFLKGNLIVPGFEDGDILCVRQRKTSAAPTRNNLGIDKDYILLFMTNEEISNAIT